MKMHVLATALGSIAICAFAETQNTIQVIKHEVAFDSCHFEMKDFYKGDLTATKYSTPAAANYNAYTNPHAHHPFETWIQFSCIDPASAKTYLDRASIKLTTKGWVLDTSKEVPGLPDLRTTLFLIHGNGWEGAGTTQDDTDGDEKRRTRAFSFCIPHKQLALCGSVQSVAYLMWPKETVLPQVLKLLESIEFIDTPPATR